MGDVNERAREFKTLHRGPRSQPGGLRSNPERRGYEPRARPEQEKGHRALGLGGPCAIGTHAMRYSDPTPNPRSPRRAVGSCRSGRGYPRDWVFTGFDKSLVNRHLSFVEAAG